MKTSVDATREEFFVVDSAVRRLWVGSMRPFNGPEPPERATASALTEAVDRLAPHIIQHYLEIGILQQMLYAQRADRAVLRSAGLAGQQWLPHAPQQ